MGHTSRWTSRLSSVLALGVMFVVCVPCSGAVVLPGLVGTYSYGDAPVSDIAEVDPGWSPFGIRLHGVSVEVEVSGESGLAVPLEYVWPRFMLSVRDLYGTVLIGPTVLGPVGDSPTTLGVEAEWFPPYWPAPTEPSEFEVVLEMPDTYPGLDVSPVLEVISAEISVYYHEVFVGLGGLDKVLSTWNQWVDPNTPGDITGDGYVGLDDLDIILSNWNAGTPPTESNVVPEPGMILCVVAGGVMMLRRRMV